jgi:hypothetical protein
MALQKLDKTLAHHSGCAQDADWIFVFHGLEHSVYRRMGFRPQYPQRFDGRKPLRIIAPAALRSA